MLAYKNVFASTTFWGIVLSLIAKLMLYFGVTEGFDDSFQNDLAVWLAGTIPFLIGLIGDGIALWGRWNASHKLSVTPNKKNAEAELDATLGVSTDVIDPPKSL